MYFAAPHPSAQLNFKLTMTKCLLLFNFFFLFSSAVFIFDFFFFFLIPLASYWIAGRAAQFVKDNPLKILQFTIWTAILNISCICCLDIKIWWKKSMNYIETVAFMFTCVFRYCKLAMPIYLQNESYFAHVLLPVLVTRTKLRPQNWTQLSLHSH